MIRSWEDLPWEQRFFYKLTSGKEMVDLERQSKAIEIVDRMGKDENFKNRMWKRRELHRRVVGDLLIVAIVLMIAGFFLCLKY